MNPQIVKQTSILSAILGAILGVLTLIPFIRNFSFTLLMLAVATVVIIYMKRKDLIGIIDIKEGAVLGAIIGFVSFIAFSLIFVVPAAILGSFFPSYYMSWLGFLLKTSVFVFIMIVFFLSVLSALMNSFAGLATVYMYEILTGVKKEEKQNENIDFEIKE